MHKVSFSALKKFCFLDLLDFMKDKFDVQGSDLKINNDEYKEYRVKIHLHTHVEGNPELRCKNYDEENLYTNCLRKSHTNKIMDLIGCMPPWLVDDKILWCNSTLAFLNGTAKQSCSFTLQVNFR